MRRTAAFATDRAFAPYCILAMLSFLRHNAGWDVVLYDVDQPNANRPEWDWGRLCRVVRHRPADRIIFGVHLPAALARMSAIREHARDGLLLSIDADTVTLGSVAAHAEAFLESGQALGMLTETDPRFQLGRAEGNWVMGNIPMRVFPRRSSWAHLPTRNAGVYFAAGPDAVATNEVCMEAYEDCKDDLALGDQTMLDSFMHELCLPHWEMPPEMNCMFWEEHLTHAGRPYRDGTEFDGTPVLVRHFATRRNRAVLDALVQDLREDLHAMDYYTG